jgi:hypothetical protein
MTFFGSDGWLKVLGDFFSLVLDIIAVAIMVQRAVNWFRYRGVRGDRRRKNRS